MSVGLSRRMTVEEYLAAEERSDVRHEYLSGHTYAMAGGTIAHDTIGGNIKGELRTALRDKPCVAHGSDLRVLIEATGLFCYPDVFVVCGQPHLLAGRNDVVLNPLVVFEVLSTSTQTYDRGDKFDHYRKLPSLAAYLLVAQDRPRVERYLRTGDDWLLTIYEGMEAIVELPALDCRLSMAEIYLKVAFPPVAAELRIVTES